DGRPAPRRWQPPVAGIVAVAAGLGAAEPAAGLLAPSSGPLLVVGAALIDLAPPWAKDAAIALFGTADKIALVVGICLVLAALAALAGTLESRRPPLGRLLVGVGAVLGVAAAMTRSDAGLLAPIPTVVATVVTAILLPLLLRTARSPVDGPDRRRFLAWAGGTAGAGALAALAGFGLQQGTRAATAVREGVTLPAPATPAAVPAGTALDIPGLTPVITPNADFYRIDTALRVPQLDPREWRLRVTGLVEREVELSWDELLASPLEESITTLACVSNEVGGGLIGTARWLGLPIRDVLERAAPRPEADMVLSRSSDGFTAGTPLPVLLDDRNAILAIGMNGEPLPLEHGFPVRMVVPGLFGYVSATKWVVELEVTRFADRTAYWTDRGWSDRGPVKLSSRIDVPRGGVDAGEVVVAGVAWFQHTGVAAVEVQVDDGP